MTKARVNADNASADIQGVTAGTGLTGGGTSGTVTLNLDTTAVIQPTIFDAKADLLTATADNTPARLAVGNNGETLVADSSTSTGLRWGNNYGFTAGKNKFINGDFRIWQRGTSFSNPKGVFLADRFAYNYDGTGNVTISQQSFTPGSAPVAGYESPFFLRINQTTAGSGTTFNVFQQPIEDVRTFAGQTVTISFWAKSDSSRSVTVNTAQTFGSGGSGDVNDNYVGFTVGTTWTRYSATVPVPSIAGKTIGTGSALRIYFSVPTNTTFTIDFWGMQIEAGSVATAFQTATGTLAGELAACQRYYYRTELSSDVYSAYAVGMAISTINARCYLKFPVRMRVKPTSIDAANLAVTDYTNYTNAATVTMDSMNTDGGVVNGNGTGFTQYRGAFIVNANNTTGYIGFNAEL